jgi:hypothetical protein
MTKPISDPLRLAVFFWVVAFVSVQTMARSTLQREEERWIRIRPAVSANQWKLPCGLPKVRD